MAKSTGGESDAHPAKARFWPGERDRRLHVTVGPECNNNCIFCMESREHRRQQNSAIKPERVREILQNERGVSEVCFTSGEPTLVPSLPEYACWARDLGYRCVHLITNGRRLCYGEYCERLVRSGVNLLTISIHGHAEKLHDGLVRAPGAFAQTEHGLTNAVRLRHSGFADLRIHTSTVVNSRNLPFLHEIFRFLRQRGVDQVVFNVMQPEGRADANFDRLFPPYERIADAFASVIAKADEKDPPAFLLDIPLCATEAIPRFNRGYVESRYFHAVTDPDPPREKSRGESRERREPVALHERAGTQVHASQKTKRNACASCVYDPVCEGVWKRYLARYGWDELIPVERKR